MFFLPYPNRWVSLPSPYKWEKGSGYEGGRILGNATRKRAQFHGDGELKRQGFYGWWLSQSMKAVWKRKRKHGIGRQKGRKKGEREK